MNEERRPARKRYRWLKILAGLVILGVVWVLAQGIWESRRFEELKTELREQGRPVELADLDLVMPAIDDNAAIDYRLANAEFQKAYNARPALDIFDRFSETQWNPARREGRDPIDPFSESDYEELAKLIEDLEPGWQHVENALDRPYCQFVDYHAGNIIDALMGDHAMTRSIARTIALKAYWELYRGNHAEALQWAGRGLRFAEQLDREGTLIAGMVRIAIAQIALNTMQDILYDAPIDLEVAPEMPDTLGRLDWPSFAQWTIASERVLMDTIGQQQGLGTGGALQGMMYKHMHYHVWKAMTMLEEATAVSDYDERAARMQEMETEYGVDTRTGSTVARIESTLSGKILAQITVPAMGRSIDAFDRAKAITEMAQLALNLREYKRSNGDYPHQLEELDIEVIPIDPFSGKPYHYQRDGEGFRLYSIGMDRNDGGGHGPLKSRIGDIVWYAAK